VNFEFATATRVVFGTGKLQDVGALALGRRALVVIGKSVGAVQRVEPMLSALTEAGVEYSTFFRGGRADPRCGADRDAAGARRTL